MDSRIATAFSVRERVLLEKIHVAQRRLCLNDYNYYGFFPFSETIERTDLVTKMYFENSLVSRFSFNAKFADIAVWTDLADITSVYSGSTKALLYTVGCASESIIYFFKQEKRTAGTSEFIRTVLWPFKTTLPVQRPPIPLSNALSLSDIDNVAVDMVLRFMRISSSILVLFGCQMEHNAYTEWWDLVFSANSGCWKLILEWKRSKETRAMPQLFSLAFRSQSCDLIQISKPTWQNR